MCNVKNLSFHVMLQHLFSSCFGSFLHSFAILHTASWTTQTLKGNVTENCAFPNRRKQECAKIISNSTEPQVQVQAQVQPNAQNEPHMLTV